MKRSSITHVDSLLSWANVQIRCLVRYESIGTLQLLIVHLEATLFVLLDAASTTPYCCSWPETPSIR
jgi:hypothetical protein